MDRFLSAINTPLFIFLQGTLNSWGAAIVAFFIVGLALGLMRAGAARRGLWWATAMPAPWVLLSLGAGWNRASDGHYGDAGPLLTGLVLLMFTVTLAVSVMAVIRVERGRLIMVGLAVINAWFAFIAGLLSVMIVSGSWI